MQRKIDKTHKIKDIHPSLKLQVRMNDIIKTCRPELAKYNN